MNTPYQQKRFIPTIVFRERRDIGELEDARRWELVFANASLQWLADHERLFERLARALVPGGQLAVHRVEPADARGVHNGQSFQQRDRRVEQVRLITRAYHPLRILERDVDDEEPPRERLAAEPLVSTRAQALGSGARPR